jgi:hypothetical protein
MDKVSSIVSNPLGDSRINHLLRRIIANRADGIYFTQAELDRAVSAIAKRLSLSIDQPLYELPEFKEGTPVDQGRINTFFLNIYREVEYLFEGILNTGGVIEENFNYAIARIKKLESDLKHCNQQLSVYSLYSKNYTNSLYFGESFSNLNNLDVNSKFLAENQCSIDLDEGTVTLPRIIEESLRPIQTIEISSTSNCVLGNNRERNVPARNNINFCFDDNVDTWVEFERIVTQEDLDHLFLELKITLESKQIVNGLKLIPVHLGARTPPIIDKLEVSADGRKWISLENEVQVAEFLGETNEERFHLSPHSSKYGNQFSILFAPRFVKFIRIVMRQTSAFPITDVYEAIYFRYAIGLREIEVHGYKYESIGEVISQSISFPNNIIATSFMSLLDPKDLPEDISTTQYFLSFDDGASWSQILPLEETSLSIPEVLFAPENTTSLRWKVVLSKDESSFSQFQREKAYLIAREVASVGFHYPATIRLANKPIKGTITVCDPLVAVRGKASPKIEVGIGITSRMSDDRSTREGAGILKLPLPIAELVHPKDVEIFVDGYEWARKSSLDTVDTDWYSQHYVIERDESEQWYVVFGNNNLTTPRGAIPDSTQQITFRLTEERVTVQRSNPPYQIVLEYPSNGEKRDTILFFEGKSTKAALEQLPSGITSYKLLGRDILDTSYIHIFSRNADGEIKEEIRFKTGASTVHSTSDPDDRFRTYKTFVDGYSELTDAMDFTIDLENGYIYFHEDTPSHEQYETTISYTYQEKKYLTEDDWDFNEGSLDAINLYEDGYFALEGTLSLTSLGTGLRSIRLGTDVWGIVPKSVKLPTDIFGSDSPYEVPFIDGVKEFDFRGIVQDEEVPVVAGVLTGGKYIASFRLTHWEDIIPNAGVTFSDTDTFEQENAFVDGASELSVQGDFSIDFSGAVEQGNVYVHLGSSPASIPTGGEVSYQYTNPATSQTINGAFSVDIKNAVIHFAKATSAANGSILYKYAPYKARYVVSQQLEEGPQKDYKVDLNNQLIKILAGAQSIKRETLSVSYKYESEEENVQDLAEYFSPLLRAIAIKVA